MKCGIFLTTMLLLLVESLFATEPKLPSAGAASIDFIQSIADRATTDELPVTDNLAFEPLIKKVSQKQTSMNAKVYFEIFGKRSSEASLSHLFTLKVDSATRQILEIAEHQVQEIQYRGNPTTQTRTTFYIRSLNPSAQSGWRWKKVVSEAEESKEFYDHWKPNHMVESSFHVAGSSFSDNFPFATSVEVERPEYFTAEPGVLNQVTVDPSNLGRPSDGVMVDSHLKGSALLAEMAQNELEELRVLKNKSRMSLPVHEQVQIDRWFKTLESQTSGIINLQQALQQKYEKKTLGGEPEPEFNSNSKQRSAPDLDFTDADVQEFYRQAHKLKTKRRILIAKLEGVLSSKAQPLQVGRRPETKSNSSSQQ